MAEGTTPDSGPPAVNLWSATKPPVPPERQAGQQDEDTPSIGSLARNLRPRPLRRINGRPIYNEDKQIPGTHFILRQLAASNNWGASLIGVVRKADKRQLLH